MHAESRVWIWGCGEGEGGDAIMVDLVCLISIRGYVRGAMVGKLKVNECGMNRCYLSMLKETRCGACTR